MTVHEILSECRSQKIQLFPEGQNLRYRAPKPLPPEMIERLKTHKPEIIEALRDHRPAPEMSETEKEAVAGWLESINRLKPSWTKSQAETKALELLEDSRRLRRARETREAAELYRKQGWLEIFSGYLNCRVYLAKDSSVTVPDPDIPRYSESEIRALEDLSLAELLTLHEAKKIFEGEVSEC